MRSVLLLSIIVMVLTSGCSSSKKTEKSTAKGGFVSKVINEEFNDGPVEKVYNEKHDLLILINRIDRGVGFPVVINFVVVDPVKNKILYTDSVSDGSVTWLDNDRIEVKRVTGAHSKNEEENMKGKSKVVDIRNLTN